MTKGQSRIVTDRTSLYDDITNKIIADLEAGHLPWVQPWGTGAAKAPLAMPKNAITGRTYSGINVLLLWGAVIAGGFSGQCWHARLAPSKRTNINCTTDFAERLTGVPDELHPSIG